MLNLSYCFKKIISYTGLGLLVATGGFTTVAQAQSAVRQWGQALQNQYYETKKLKGRSTPAQRREINSRVFASANASFNNEVIKKQTRLGTTMSKLHNIIESEINSARKDKAIAKTKGMTLAQYRKSLKGQPGAPGKDGKPGNAGGAGKGGRGTSSNRHNGTGQVGDADGAKDVTFGGKQEEEKPNVNIIDGIIQD